MKERYPVHACREMFRVLLAATATTSLAIGMLACSQQRNSQSFSPPLSPDASPDLMPLAGDAGNELPGPDSLADVSSDSSPLQVEVGVESRSSGGSADTETESTGIDARDGRGISQLPDVSSDSLPSQVEAGTESGSSDGSADSKTESTGIDARDDVGISQLPITACADIQLSDPDEILAAVPNVACTGNLHCDFGPPTTVCGLSFGPSVSCWCFDNVMSCEDVRQIARDQEGFELSVDGGASCPMPSRPHDAGLGQQSSAGN